MAGSVRVRSPALRHFELFRRRRGRRRRGPSRPGLGPGSAAAFARQNCAGFTSERRRRRWQQRDFFSSLSERASERAETSNIMPPPLSLSLPPSANCGCGGHYSLLHWTPRRCRWTWMHRMSRGCLHVGASSVRPSASPRPSPIWAPCVVTAVTAIHAIRVPLPL